MKRDPKKLPRFTASERTNHWLVAITFFLVALSGLALFHPLFFPLTHLFGGGPWDRILHPFFGVAMLFFFTGMFFRFWKLSLINRTDREWLGHVREMINGDDTHMPESGKLNGGQKLMFWLLVFSMLLLVVSGFIMWRPYFAHLFPVGLIRLAAVVHAATGALIIALIIAHIYLAIWTKESIDAMLHGRVRRAWAKQHHPAWYREMTGGGK